METETMAQAIGIVAMAFNILSYQGKKQSTVIALQLIGGALFAVNFLMIGAAIGGILNGIAFVRAIIFLNKKKLKADNKWWLAGFTVVYFAVYVLSFTVFGTKPTAFNFVIELLPVAGMVATNIGFMMKQASDVRKCGLVSSPTWLTYNIVVGSYGAIICESVTLVSIFVGMLRHDRKKQ